MKTTQETACKANQKTLRGKKKLTCSKPPQPGSTQGNCPFDGAMVSTGAITDAVHLVHGAVSCTHNPWATHGSLSSGSQLYQTAFTTDFSEGNIVFGGEKKLYKAILYVAQHYHPAAIFVYATCLTALIGDDIDSVCKMATQQINIPVIYVNAPGFLGSKNLGNRIGNETLLNYVIGTAEPEFTTPLDINIVGDYNVAGETWNILPLFQKLGIRVLAKITGDARYQEVCYAHRVKLNVVLCSNVAIQMAQTMQESYGIPYIEESFYGVTNLNNCLRNIAAKLSLSLEDSCVAHELQKRTEDLIAQETAALDIALAPYLADLKCKRIILSTGGVKSWSLILAAKDLGMEVIAATDGKTTDEEKVKIKQYLGEDGIVLSDTTPQALLKALHQTKADVLITGAGNKYTALKAQIPFLDINHERHHAYAGYTGLVELARELHEALYSPIWEQISKAAPWDEKFSYAKY
ncbi:nitrogenase iron-molybdenum cofactor biosynthesis protein NifE [Aulosira sp. FACHB-615]|uniref:nitrogenase iron-molybdenum cofactor biosynthesis protein NifE n=1 Tax=Aulosira sp. FACHB-615 TaxID=2692777 RepID=UPI001687A834|nr:nitrogenase iron-molybdenum cofactor biosynthesis protein NifE [Aulosira sp. FACHB-615]MBD2489338.1 nitrogenase iron-molybdenum cofactor biosynthesis protein NifE [Aulosira sp. FACHB-615]